MLNEFDLIIAIFDSTSRAFSCNLLLCELILVQDLIDLIITAHFSRSKYNIIDGERASKRLVESWVGSLHDFDFS